MKPKPQIVSPQDSLHRVHTYFKGSPYHPDGRRVLCSRFESIEGEGEVCLLDRETGEEEVLGGSNCLTYHNGASPYFCDGGRKVIWRETHDTVAVLDLHTGEKTALDGNICLYSGVLDKHFIQMDEGWPLEEQNRMGIWLRSIDGKEKTLLADVDKMLENSPRGGAVRSGRILLRLGGEISPDQKTVILFLVANAGTLVRDYYTCDFRGEGMEFHGNLGTHIMWHPDSRRIYSYARPWSTPLGDLREHFGPDGWRLGKGLLARYDTATREMEVVSDYPIPGGCHVSPSPDGTRAVLDCLPKNIVKILLWDETRGEMRELCELPRALPREPMKEGRMAKHYDMNPHPAFSLDGGRILFNSCTDGTVRLYEMEV